MHFSRNFRSLSACLLFTATLIAGWAGGYCIDLSTAVAATGSAKDSGQRDGRFTLEHANGETHVVASYRDGVLTGAYREYNDHGQLTLQAMFREGVLYGRLERRADSGERLEICRYREGRREGTRQIFSEGRVVLTEVYEAGELTSQGGDASADPGPPTFAIDTDGGAGQDNASENPEDPVPDRDARPAHQQDTSLRPRGYPVSIDDLTRAFERIDELRIDGNPDEQQLIAIRQLIKYRLLCGIADPILAFDANEAILAQRASEVCHALGRLSHEPPNPGLPEDVYRDGAAGAARSNLAGPASMTPRSAMEIWMVDYGSNNRDSVGHRRWCLSPGLTEVAYGYHEDVASLLVSGNTRAFNDYDIIAYPGIGYQPVEYYDYIHMIRGEDLIWSLHLDPRSYQTPESEDQLRITVTQVTQEGEPQEIRVKRIHFAEKGNPLDGILFEPEIARLEAGTIYEVSVEGLQRRRRPYILTYRVEFFELDEDE